MEAPTATARFEKSFVDVVPNDAAFDSRVAVPSASLNSWRDSPAVFLERMHWRVRNTTATTPTLALAASILQSVLVDSLIRHNLAV